MRKREIVCAPRSSDHHGLFAGFAVKVAVARAARYGPARWLICTSSAASAKTDAVNASELFTSGSLMVSGRVLWKGV